MARPRRIKYGNGEIVLSGYSPDEANAIQAKLQESAKELTEAPQVGDIVKVKEETIEVVDPNTLSETAVDLYFDKDKKEYKLIHIKYSPLSMSAKVTGIFPAGSFRLAGTNNFKIELVKLGKF